jgi:hypothetical protein
MADPLNIGRLDVEFFSGTSDVVALDDVEVTHLPETESRPYESWEIRANGYHVATVQVSSDSYYGGVQLHFEKAKP